MKAIVIGSEGNIGKHLVPYLVKNGYEVASIDIKPDWREAYWNCDINMPIDMVKVFMDFKPSVVFLLASMVSRVTCEQSPGMAITTNVVGINNVVQLCKIFDSKLIYFSTSEVYGNVPEMREDVEVFPNNRYGLTKYIGEQIIQYEVQSHGLRAITIRPFMMCDENETIGENRSAMIRFASNIVMDLPINVHAGSFRSWLHVSDAIVVIEKCSRQESYQIFNIGHPDGLYTIDLAKMIVKEANRSEKLINVIEIPNKMTIVKKPYLKKQSEILKFIPLISIDEIVKRVVHRCKMDFSLK